MQRQAVKLQRATCAAIAGPDVTGLGSTYLVGVTIRGCLQVRNRRCERWTLEEDQQKWWRRCVFRRGGKKSWENNDPRTMRENGCQKVVIPCFSCFRLKGSCLIVFGFKPLKYAIGQEDMWGTSKRRRRPAAPCRLLLVCQSLAVLWLLLPVRGSDCLRFSNGGRCAMHPVGLYKIKRHQPASPAAAFASRVPWVFEACNDAPMQLDSIFCVFIFVFKSCQFLKAVSNCFFVAVWF